MVECDSRKTEMAGATEKPQYIFDLEKEILTLTPDEAAKASAFVSALKAGRTPAP